MRLLKPRAEKQYEGDRAKRQQGAASQPKPQSKALAHGDRTLQADALALQESRICLRQSPVCARQLLFS